MNKKLFVFYLLVILSITKYNQQIVFGQNSGFVKTYFFEERSTIFYAIRNYGDDVVIVGSMGPDEFGNNGALLARIDSLGAVMKLFVFQDPSNENSLYLGNVLYEALTVSQNGDIIFSGSTNSLNELFHIYVSPDLNHYRFYAYDSQFPGSRYVFNSCLNDSFLYSVGYARSSSNSYEAIVTKCDMFGNQIWEKIYGSPLQWDIASAIIPHDGNLIVFGNSRESNTTVFEDYKTRTIFIEIDTAGHELFRWKSEIDEEGPAGEGLLEFADKYYYITHPRIIDDVGNVHYYPQLVCRDLDYNLIWRKEYGEPYFMNYFNDIIMGPDGYLFAAGYIPVDGITWGRVCKIDPTDGELIWEARDTAFVVPGWGSRNRMEGLAVLSSGSVIAAGYTVDTDFREHGLLYKVTADGCLDTLCTTVAIEDLLKNPDDRVVVFPNPTSSIINFKLPDVTGTYIVELFTLQGSVLYHEILGAGTNVISFDRSIYPSGLYIWNVRTHAGQIVDSGKIMIAD